MGTITEVSDADPVRWPSSYWRSVKVRVFSFFSCQFVLLSLHAGSLYDLALFLLVSTPLFLHIGYNNEIRSFEK